ncbi:type II secretion system protein GspD, partial [Verrucomicrobiota bacterium]
EDNRLQVLSSPTVLTRDGMEAEISFGEEVPVKQSSVSDTGRETFSYDYRDAKISLKVTPHIDDNRMVTLALEQELKQVDEENSSDEAPRFRTRELKSSLQVFDNQTLVLGGLIQRKDVEYSIGVPILSRIPIIKYLFSRNVKSKVGSEILMILTPRVIENVSQADSLTAEYRNKVLGSLDVKDVRTLYNIEKDPAPAKAEVQ